MSAIFLAAAALAAGIALALHRAEPPSAIRAEPSIALPTSRATALNAPPASVPGAAPSLVESAPLRPPSPPPVRSAPATLEDETSALERAQAALAQGNAAAALKELDHYDRELKGHQLRDEATLLRIEALARAGQKRAASELAKRFVEKYPQSPLADRARGFIASGQQ